MLENVEVYVAELDVDLGLDRKCGGLEMPIPKHASPKLT
jgi:hypothetical protein